MKETKSANQLLADEIAKELVKANLISKDNKEFLEKFASGNLKELDWRTNLLDRIHHKQSLV